MKGEWKLWDGWGPAKDGLMRCARIGPPAEGGLRAFDSAGLSPVDIEGTCEDLDMVVNAVNAFLRPGPRCSHPQCLRAATKTFTISYGVGAERKYPRCDEHPPGTYGRITAEEPA